MRSDFVVFLPPRFDEVAGFGQGGEPVLIEAFVAELAVEAFDERVLRGFTWGGEVQLHAALPRPIVQDFAGELGAVVERDGLGQAVGLGQTI